MDAVIRLTPEELTEEFFMQLKAMARTSSRIEIKLDSVDAVNNLSEDEIDQRLTQLSEGKTVSFTMQEFKAYIDKMAG